VFIIFFIKITKASKSVLQVAETCGLPLRLKRRTYQIK